MNIPNLKFSENAANKVFELIFEESNDLNLRVSISGGGCSGFSYGFIFDEKINDDDIVITTKGIYNSKEADIKLVVDPISFQYLQGAEIDYEVSLQGEQFVVNNPNANTTCGCGNSFSI